MKTSHSSSKVNLRRKNEANTRDKYDFNCNPFGKKRRGCPREKWNDEVKDDLRSMEEDNVTRGRKIQENFDISQNPPEDCTARMELQSLQFLIFYMDHSI